MSDDIAHKQTLLDIYGSRLRERQKQAALYGPLTDPAITIEIVDLNQRIQTLTSEIALLRQDAAALVESTPVHIAQEILDLLEITYVTFVAQSRVRNKLFDMLYTRLKLTEIYEYEELFTRYYARMNDEEKHFHASLRAYTENALAVHNQRILDLIRSCPPLEQAVPSLRLLKQHLILWLSKYQGLFTTHPDMAVVYVGVEEGVPFPRNAQEELRAYLTAHTASSAPAP